MIEMMRYYWRWVNILNVGLVLEGGGMRGVYTAGVLDFFLEKNLSFPYVVGVSAGANNGANFVARQRGRSKRIYLEHSRHPEYMGLKNLIKEKSYFGMDFLFDILADKLDPFDYKAFGESPTCFKVVVTERETGEAAYFQHRDFDPEFFAKKVLRASSSLPFISRPVEIKGKYYFDGGIADSIPVRKAIEDGYKYNIIILTRNKSYRKEPAKISFLADLVYRKYPGLIKSLKNRYLNYNKTLDFIAELEEKKQVFVFRPIKQLEVTRTERDRDKLKDLYEQGYMEAAEQYGNLLEWINDIRG